MTVLGSLGGLLVIIQNPFDHMDNKQRYVYAGHLAHGRLTIW